MNDVPASGTRVRIVKYVALFWPLPTPQTILVVGLIGNCLMHCEVQITKVVISSSRIRVELHIKVLRGQNEFSFSL